jgi:hypothetical protein
MYKGHADSVALDLTDSILASLSQKITIAKNGLVFNQELVMRFKTARRKSLYGYLALFRTQNGLECEITKHHRSKLYRLTFRGLWQYDDVSALMRRDLFDALSHLRGYCSIARLDVAFDSDKPFGIGRIAKAFGRVPHRYQNTIYLKTPKEARTNRHLNIKFYRKAAKLWRMEFVFERRYFVGGADEVINRLCKVITKAIGKRFKFDEVRALISYCTEI